MNPPIIMYNKLKRLLTYHITMGIIVTSDKRVLTPTCHFCTTNLEALPPYDLGIVQAIFVLSTRICVMIVVTSFSSPCFNSITWFPILATSPKEVFTIVCYWNESKHNLLGVGEPTKTHNQLVSCSMLEEGDQALLL